RTASRPFNHVFTSFGTITVDSQGQYQYNTARIVPATYAGAKYCIPPGFNQENNPQLPHTVAPEMVSAEECARRDVYGEVKVGGTENEICNC
ncbi:MAG: hypothetical protein QME21_13425, partial [Anaerolineales bacterium]|nr:hypothetical protein [Anaerolineales bacterium]